MIGHTDTPRWLLSIAVRWMSAERSDWGEAMLAELARLQHPCTRWQFALSCTRVALFPPRKEGRLQTMNNNTNRIITTFAVAGLISLILIAPFAWLELRLFVITSRNLSDFPVLVFGVLWLLATVFFLTAAPIVRTVRTGDKLLAQPVTLLFRIVFLTLIAMMWGGLFMDQLPCFLGVPNCD